MNTYPMPGSWTAPGSPGDPWGLARALAARAANQAVVDAVQWVYDLGVLADRQAQIGRSLARALLPPGFARDAASVVFDLQSGLAGTGQQAATRWGRSVAHKAFGFGC